MIGSGGTPGPGGYPKPQNLTGSQDEVAVVGRIRSILSILSNTAELVGRPAGRRAQHFLGDPCRERKVDRFGNHTTQRHVSCISRLA